MSVTPDLIVNAIALVAAVLAMVPVAQAWRASATAGRVLALLAGLALLLAARLLAWSGTAAANVPLMLVASWLPLLVLLVAEQIVRRHARAWMKWLVLIGGLGFTLASLVAGAWWDGPVLLALAALQVVATLCAVAVLVAGRRDVSAPEATQAAIFAAALLVALPLGVSDFRAFSDLPVRGGAFGVLLLVLVIARFVGGTARWRAVAIDVATLAVAAALLAWGAGVIWRAASTTELVQVAAIGAAVAALALIVQRRGEARLLARTHPSIVAAVAALPDDAGADAILSAHPLLAAGRPVDGEVLAPYPPGLVGALAERRVATRAAGDLARDLLDATAATHLVRLSAAPPRFLAVAAGGLTGDTLAAELAAVSRMVEGAAA
ncbi:hypothetical protein [Sphingomonas sp. VNH70]|uniref:hypothetical protein n=1 Tax=Sphingomonas silueang TaxID=3156617 RepID=UPI0032B34EBA